MHKPKHFPHQTRIYDATKDAEVRGEWWEQGTGKTRTAVDVACHLYKEGRIDTVLAISPGEVPYVWSNQFREWADYGTLGNTRTQVVRSGKFKQKGFQRNSRSTIKWEGLALVCISYDTIKTAGGMSHCLDLLKERDGQRTLIIIDECTHVKTPPRSCQATKAVEKISKICRYRRALTGTIVDNNPFDLYMPVRILDPAFWPSKGIRSMTAFKSRYAKWEQGYNHRTMRNYPIKLGYQRMDELKRYLAEIGDRVPKDVLGLPPKLYSTVPFEMTSKQRKMYDKLKDELLLEMDSGDTVSAPLALTMILRLQQIACGYIGTDEGNMVDIDPPNPRIKCLNQILSDIGGQCIIWGKFRRDIDLIMELLGKKAVRYDGQTGTADRLKAIDEFQSGDRQYFVANPACAGEGITLTAATTVIYYANNYKLGQRLQSEDRAHRAGQKHAVSYIDICAMGTVDEEITASLVEKKTMADFLQGDALRDWIKT